jgi:hypothetical protein
MSWPYVFPPSLVWFQLHDHHKYWSRLHPSHVKPQKQKLNKDWTGSGFLIWIIDSLLQRLNLSGSGHWWVSPIDNSHCFGGYSNRPNSTEVSDPLPLKHHPKHPKHPTGPWNLNPFWPVLYNKDIVIHVTEDQGQLPRAQSYWIQPNTRYWPILQLWESSITCIS